MTNAATALAALIERWSIPKNESPEAVRGITTASDQRTFWRDQARAVELAYRVDNILRGMDAAGQPAAMFDASMVSWYQAVFTYTAPWQSAVNGDREIIEAARLENLQGLGVMLDQVGSVVISADGKESLCTALEEAKALVESDRSLGLESRRYIWSLIVEAIAALDEIDKFGDEPARSILLELGGAMGVQADIADGEGDKPTANRWRATRDTLVGGFTGGLGAQLAIKAAEVTQKAIETGLS